MSLSYDIILDDTAFTNAAADIELLKKRTENLRVKLEAMYESLVDALNTPAGQELKSTAKSVLIEPINKLMLVIEHISTTLSQIIGTGYYKDIFIKYETLNNSIQFNA